MSFNDTHGLRVTESPELGPAMLRMEGAHNGPAMELTLQWLLRELRLLKAQQQRDALDGRKTAVDVAGQFELALDALRRDLLAQMDNVGERQIAAGRGRFDAQEAYLTAGFVGVVRGLTDLRTSQVAHDTALLSELMALRSDLQRRTFGARVRRFWEWLTGGWR